MTSCSNMVDPASTRTGWSGWRNSCLFTPMQCTDLREVTALHKTRFSLPRDRSIIIANLSRSVFARVRDRDRACEWKMRYWIRILCTHACVVCVFMCVVCVCVCVCVCSAMSHKESPRVWPAYVCVCDSILCERDVQAGRDWKSPLIWIWQPPQLDGFFF